MKKSQLRQIIREEISKAINENPSNIDEGAPNLLRMAGEFFSIPGVYSDKTKMNLKDLETKMEEMGFERGGKIWNAILDKAVEYGFKGEVGMAGKMATFTGEKSAAQKIGATAAGVTSTRRKAE